MSQMTHSLTELVSALNDGIAFYDEVARKTNNHVYTDVFTRMRHFKTAIVADLNAEIAIQGEQPKSDGTWLGGLRINYADLLAGMSEHPDHSYVSQIEAQEDRVLEAFQSAIASDKSERVRELAMLYLPEVQLMHDEMRALKNISAIGSIKS